MALLIGNGKYHLGPLANPANDARAIAESLLGMKFNVKVLLDATLREMTDGIKGYIDRVSRENAIGLFYYAGHGAQLAWRNFLIPVDATIGHLEDIPQQAYELNLLLGGLAKAVNPMNIIILDACRDNPFGNRVLPEQKGLSQFDAPPGSLLAYATSPGNTASDGSGANGLFTEHLLREMRNPQAKIEDVFKRVRLNVRLQSNGQQIPWESTSLEDDFYFVPQGEKPRDSRDEAGAKLQEERALWDGAAGSPDPKLTEAYLSRYPNGIYSELAQARLDKLLAAQGEKKLEVVSSTANPFSKGSAKGVGSYSIGDRFSYAEKDPISGVVQKTFTEVVTSADEFSTSFDGGKRILDLLGNEIKSPITRFLTPAQFYPAEYVVGQKWITKFQWLKGDGIPSFMELGFRVVERRNVAVSAGTFNAFVVEGSGQVVGGGAWRVSYLIDPDKCSRPIVMEMIGKGRIGGRYDPLSHKMELLEFRQMRPG